MFTHNYRNQPLRSTLMAGVAIAIATLVIHVAWRHIAPAIGWLEVPTFGQSVTVVIALFVVGRLLNGRRPRGDYQVRSHYTEPGGG